jgi:hypothetical protein
VGRRAPPHQQGANSRPPWRGPSATPEASPDPRNTRNAPPPAAPAVLDCFPTARPLGFSGPPGAAASGGQLTPALARPKRHAGSLTWSQEYQKRRTTSPPRCPRLSPHSTSARLQWAPGAAASGANSRPPWRGPSATPEASPGPRNTRHAAPPAPRAVLPFSPTPRVLGFSGPPGATAPGGQLTPALARPKRHARSLT